MWEVEGSAWGCSLAADAKGNAGFEGQPELAVRFRLQAFAGSAACSKGGGALACRAATRGQRLQRLMQEAAASFMGARAVRARPGRRRPAQDGGAMRAQMGPARACGSGAGWVKPRARPNPVDRFFSNLFF
jgi:hypothetical protein